MSDHTPRTRKSQQRTLGDQPVHIVTYGHYFNLDSGYPVQHTDFCENFVNKAILAFSHNGHI